MSESTSDPNSPASQTNPTRTSTPSWPTLKLLVIPILAALLLYQLDTFDPAPIPIPESTHSRLTAPLKNNHVLKGSEFVGVGKMVGPEDIAYDEEFGVMYTGCADGWIKRVTVNDSVSDSVVEDWVNTGGRPLGIVLGHQGDVIVADSYKNFIMYGETHSMKVYIAPEIHVPFRTFEVQCSEEDTVMIAAYNKEAMEEFGILQKEEEERTQKSTVDLIQLSSED